MRLAPALSELFTVYQLQNVCADACPAAAPHIDTLADPAQRPPVVLLMSGFGTRPRAQRSDPAAEHHQQMQDAAQGASIKRHPGTAILVGPGVRVSTSLAGQFSSGQDASCRPPDDA
jgi:hypothetical protein